MRRVALMLTVAIVMAVMIVTSAMPAMASKGESASGGKVCNAPGIENAHESGVPEDEGHVVPGEAEDHTATAHENIPCEHLF